MIVVDLPEPPTAKVSIYNLSAKSRGALQDVESLPALVEAGYGSDLGQLCLGDLRNARSRKQGPDWITTLVADIAIQVQERIEDDNREVTWIAPQVIPDMPIEFARSGN